MGLKHVFTKRFQGVQLRSGYFYRFKYHPWHNDPKPVIIFMSWIGGIHNTSGREWRFFQAINFTYIPRAMRQRFLKSWMKELDKKGKKEFTWQKIKSKYPYLKPAIRRYFYSPPYYVKNLQTIPLENVEKVVVSTFSKDFSKKIKTTLMNKFRKAKAAIFNRKKKKNNKKKKRKR